MHRRALGFIRDGLLKLKLRVKYQFGFGNLPAVATHLACFLGGTLLFQPDTRGKAPAEMLVPWSLSRIVGGVQLGSDYQLVSESRNCLLFDTGFRLWRPEDKRVFVILPKVSQWTEVASALQKTDTRLYRQTRDSQPKCQKTSANAKIYP